MNSILDMQDKIDYEKIKIVSEHIKNGGLVIFPTETVYGIGTNGFSSDSVLKIFEAKGRKADNPLILHISNKDMLKTCVKNVNEIESKLIDNFWPGPLTIIFYKKEIVPNIVSANLDTVGVRMPSNKIANLLIKYAGVPIAAPSANISGSPSGTNINDIKDEFRDKVDYIIDGGDSKIGLESTVVRVINDTIYILRPGFITKEDLLEITDKVIVDKNVLAKPSGEPVLSPGVKYRHYAPKVPCTLIFGSAPEKVIAKINEESKKYSKVLVMTKNSHVNYFANSISYGDSLEEMSHNIFSLLRKVDNGEYEAVIIEGVELAGLGLAIMNRLYRACSYNVIKV